MNPLSKCCASTVRVEGDTTRYYVCEKCGEACDLKTCVCEKMTPQIKEFNGLPIRCPQKHNGCLRYGL